MPTNRGTILRYLLIFAAIALAPVFLSHLNPQPAPPAPAPVVTPTQPITQSPPSPVDEPAVVGSQVPPLSAERMRSIELGLALLGGDSKPAWIMAVTTTLPQALRDSPRVKPERGSPYVVYLVVMKGTFAYPTVGSIGIAAPTGHYIAAIFTPLTLTPLGTTLTGQAPAIPLGHLGPVIDLLHVQ